MLLQLLFVLAAIIVGARLGGIGLGVMGGVGLAILTFVFGLQPTAPPIDVMLMMLPLYLPHPVCKRQADWTLWSSWQNVCCAVTRHMLLF